MTKRAAIYVRVSKNRDDDRAKPDRQIESCTHLAKAKELEIVFEPFVDDDVSAYQGKTPRPAYKALMERVRAGEVDVVLCWHVDRLLRTTKEMLTFIELAKETRVSVESTQAGSLDPSTPVGKMVAVILSAVAEQEVEIKSQRHLLKNQQTRANGGSTGGPVPFGWTKSGALIEVEAAQLRAATRGICEGTTNLTKIANEWNAMGSTTTFSKPWTHTGVKKVLVRPRNAGLVDHKGAILKGVVAAWEAAVSREQWQACRDILTASTKPVAPRKHLLSGLLICTRCDRPMTAGTAVSKVKDKRYTYAIYKHGPDMRGCGATVRQDAADNKVKGCVRYLLTNRNVETFTGPSAEVGKAMDLRIEAAKVELKMHELEELWSEGEFSTGNYRKRRADFAAALEDIVKALGAIERDDAFAAMLSSTMGVMEPLTMAAAVQERFDALSLEHRRVIVRTLFPRIEVGEGRGSERVHMYEPDGTAF